MKLDFNFNGKTVLKQWWTQVKANFQTIQDNFNALSGRLDTETEERRDADNALSTSINQEITDRQRDVMDLERTLQSDINTEATSRQNADDVIRNLMKNYVDTDNTPIHLSDYPGILGDGCYYPPFIPNMIFKIVNDTEYTVDKFQDTDDHYTQLSSPINPGETRLCIGIKAEVGGADPENGYVYVLDDTDMQNAVRNEAAARRKADDELKESISRLGAGSVGNINCRSRLKALKAYADAAWTLTTDSEGNKYLVASDFTSGVISHYKIYITAFEQQPSFPSDVIFDIGFAYRHLADAAAACTGGELDTYETVIVINYADGTSEKVRFYNGMKMMYDIATSKREITVHNVANTYDYYDMRCYFKTQKAISSMVIDLAFEHSTDASETDCTDYILVDKLALCDNDSFAVVREIMDIRQAIAAANVYVKLSRQIKVTGEQPDDELQMLSLTLDIPAYTVYMENGAFTTTAEYLDIEITEAAKEYIYYQAEISSSGDIISDWSYYAEADKSGVTELPGGGYRILWLLGRGYYRYEPGPGGEPASSSQFELLCSDTQLVFNGDTNRDNPLLSELTTQNKTSIIGAINEINTKLGTLNSELDAVNGVG